MSVLGVEQGMKSRVQQGFSLLEASIVLVMIGLVAGIVMFASGLQQRQKLRNVITDAQTYSTAMWQFKQQYGSLPGDMPNATEVWGTANNSPFGSPDADQCTNPATDVSTVDAKRTCNGDGDGIIEIEIKVPAVGCEAYRAWQQMAAAGFIEGGYSGVSQTVASCGRNSITGVNTPATAIGNSTFSIASIGEIGNGDAIYYPGNYNNVLFYGEQLVNFYSVNPAITPTEAREVDSKTDDGNPAIGKVRNVRPGAGSTPNCVTTSVAGDIYGEQNQAVACAVIFMSDFVKKTDQ